MSKIVNILLLSMLFSSPVYAGSMMENTTNLDTNLESECE